jgi:heme exporter protein B
MLLAKVTALFVFLSALEVVAVPAFTLLLLARPLGPLLPRLLPVLALANIAFAVIGTVVSAIAVQSRARDLIGPLVALPLLLPALIAMARAIGPVLRVHGTTSAPARWLAVLALYDLVNVLVAYAVFDFLLED